MRTKGDENGYRDGHGTDLEDSPPAFRWAAPSWVVPGSVADNCRHLATRVPPTRPREVALCLFETSSCLAYGPGDLPAETMGLSFHVHLPLDLPWEDRGRIPKSRDGLFRMGREVALVCERLVRKVDHLSPRAVVLHPPACEPQRAAILLESFLAHWENGPGVLLENTRHSDILSLFEQFPGLFAGQALSLCLDLGHLVRYKQDPLLATPLVKSAPMAHWNLAGPDGHKSLEGLSRGELELARAMMALLPATCMHVIELFSWEDVERSLPVVRGLWEDAHASTRAEAARGPQRRTTWTYGTTRKDTAVSQGVAQDAQS